MFTRKIPVLVASMGLVSRSTTAGTATESDGPADYRR
jgi:hypothetical protein